MAVTNLLKPQIDQPVYEWCRFAPFTASSLAAFASDPSGTGRYIYAISGTTFWRYDTISDSWEELNSPVTAGTVLSAMCYDPAGGVVAEPISATSNTITVGGIYPKSLVGATIRIVSGTGAGQTRTITSVADPVIASTFTISSAATTSITDVNAKWFVNQYRNYGMRLNYGGSPGVARRIIFNDPTVLYFADGSYSAFNTWSNPILGSSPSIGTLGVIDSVTLTVNTPWTVTPTSNSRFQIQTGIIWLASSAGSASGVWLQAYDIATDVWYTRSSIGSSFNGSYATDFAIDKPMENAGVWEANSAITSATARTVTNSAATMTFDNYANFALKIVSGPGAGQVRRIVANNATTFWLSNDWDVTPTSSSLYSVLPDFDKLYLVGGAASYIYQYSIEADQWSTNPISDWGVARSSLCLLQITAPPSGYANITPKLGVSSILPSTIGIATFTIANGGTGYSVGDRVTINTTTFFVTSINDSTGAVTGLDIGSRSSTNSLTTYTASGGTGSGLQVTVTGLTTFGTVTLGTYHPFVNGQTVTIGNLATNYDFQGTFVISCSSAASFTVVTSSGGSTTTPTFQWPQTANSLFDLSKSWVASEHLAKTAQVIAAGSNPSLLKSAKITVQTLGFSFITNISATPLNGASRYLIVEPNAFGQFTLSNVPGRGVSGWATSATATTLVDTSKSWLRNQWVNTKIRIESGTGTGGEATITANTSNTITVASWPNGTPDTTSKYEILNACGICTTAGVAGTLTDGNQNWPVNSLVGKRVKFVSSSSVYGTDYSITSNTAMSLVLSGGQVTTLDSTYVILDAPAKATGMVFYWLGGLSDPTKKGKQFILFRGGVSSLYDIYDITTNKWELAPSGIPAVSPTFTGGTMSVYDKQDSIYITKDNTGRVYRLNISDYTMTPCSTTPYAHGPVSIGNRMGMITTTDGLKYLYIMRHSGSEMWRTLVFW